jgi:hypothetical protein
MRVPANVANPGLAALIAGSGFPSFERFAAAVNHRGWELHGVRTCYDHVTVKRWLAGSICQYPDVVAAVLSDAWGIEVPEAVIWPDLRDGRSPVPAHLQPWAAARTLAELGLFVRSDMLTRRELLAASVAVATGKELTDPIARWLGADTASFGWSSETVGGQINTATVQAIEEATRQFVATDAAVGGGVIREAAIGQLKYAVDLATGARYTEAVGNRLLTAIADLAGQIGWMSHDVGMAGPAQRYFVYGLQAAREAHGDEARLRAVGILADMAAQMTELGHPDTALRLTDLAFDQLPADGRRFNKVRSVLWSQRAARLANMGAAQTSEVRSAAGLASDLYGQQGDDDTSPAVIRCFPYTTDAEVASNAATAYLELAQHSSSFATDAERQALYALGHRPDGFHRSRVFDQITLAQARFLGGEREQAALDSEEAIRMAERITASRRVNARLRELPIAAARSTGSQEPST